MASLAFGAIGAAIGSTFALGAGTYAALGFSIGSTIGSMLFPPDLPDIQGARLNDLKVQASTYGQMIPIMYGTVRLAGSVIWASDLVETRHDEDYGGKGGGGGTSTTYTYAANCLISACESNDDRYVTKIWADGRVIYNASIGDTLPTGVRILRGGATQQPDPMVEVWLGVGNVPAYRGLLTIAFETFQLENYGNRIPNFTFEVTDYFMGAGYHNNVDDIIRDISYRCGLTVLEVEASAIALGVAEGSESLGYTIPSQMSGRTAIVPLVQTYAFDAVESDNVVRFVKRGGSSTITITADELVN